MTPNDYAGMGKDLYDADYPPYVAIYETIRSICKEQRGIVDEGIDLSVLSSILGALPRLKEVGLSFCDSIELENWFLPGMTMVEESYENHLGVISNAVKSARNRGIDIHTVSLLGFRFPFYDELPRLSTLLRSLEKLLEFVSVLRLTDSGFPLEVLSHCTMNLHRLDMCSLVVGRDALQNFLQRNKSIQYIGFHDVKIVELSQLSYLSSGLLCGILNMTQSTPSRTADCGCFLFRKGLERHSARTPLKILFKI